jgi:hypothetical protein
MPKNNLDPENFLLYRIRIPKVKKTPEIPDSQHCSDLFKKMIAEPDMIFSCHSIGNRWYRICNEAALRNPEGDRGAAEEQQL